MSVNRIYKLNGECFVGVPLIGAIVVLVGSAGSAQSGVNASLALAIGQAAGGHAVAGLTAATISFAISFGIVGSSAAAEAWLCLHQSGGSRSPPSPSHAPVDGHAASDGCSRARPYEFCGGLIGAVFVTTALVLGPVIGFEVFYVLMVCGQLLMSAVIDHKGLLGVRTVRMSKAKLTALLVSFGGAVMTAVEDLIAADDQVGGVDSAKLLLYWAVTLAVGCALPIQAALNWRLGERLRSKFRAAVVSFGAGLAVLVCALTVHGAGNSLWPNFGETQWWQYVGGLLGVVFVMSGIAFAGRIGVTLYFTCAIAGQLIGSLVLDSAGAFGFDQRPLTALRMTGTVCVVLATAALGRIKHIASRNVSELELSTTTTVDVRNPIHDLAKHHE